MDNDHLRMAKNTHNAQTYEQVSNFKMYGMVFWRTLEMCCTVRELYGASAQYMKAHFLCLYRNTVEMCFYWKYVYILEFTKVVLRSGYWSMLMILVFVSGTDWSDIFLHKLTLS